MFSLRCINTSPSYDPDREIIGMVHVWGEEHAIGYAISRTMKTNESFDENKYAKRVEIRGCIKRSERFHYSIAGVYGRSTNISRVFLFKKAEAFNYHGNARKTFMFPLYPQ